MTWKVNYNDIIRVPQEKWRTSMASLIRRNSQRVNDAVITFFCAFAAKENIYRVKFVLNVRLCFLRLIFSVALFPQIHLFYNTLIKFNTTTVIMMMMIIIIIIVVIMLIDYVIIYFINVLIKFRF